MISILTVLSDKSMSFIEQPPDLYARKLSALAKTFKAEAEKNPSVRVAPSVTRKRFMLKATIDFVGGKHCKYVSKKYRPKSEMIAQLEAYCVRWFGMTMEQMQKETDGTKVVLEHYRNALWEDQSSCSFLDESKQSQLHRACDQGFGVTPAGDRYVVLQKKRGSVDFADKNNIAWAKSSRRAFSNALMFRTGADKKVLGKSSVIKAVLNLGIRIHKGCFDLHDSNYGLGFYQDAGAPISKVPRKGLVVIETAIGQTELEAHFRSIKHVTATTLTLADPELEARLSFGYLNQNYNVDVKNCKPVPPNPIYWRFNRTNRLVQAVFGSRLWQYRDPMSVELADEPFLGYGSYRYESAGLKATPEARLRYALKGFQGSQSQNRWTFDMGITLLHSPASTETTFTPRANQLATGPSPAEGGTTEPLSKTTETSSSTRLPKTQMTSTVAVKRKSNGSTVAAKRKAPGSSGDAQSLKRRRVEAPCARSSKTIRTGTKSSLIKSFFTPGTPNKSEEGEIRGRIAATIASSPPGVSTTKVCIQVAREFNESRLEFADAVSGCLISCKSVANDMHNCAKGAAASKTLRSVAPKRKRNGYKKKPIETLYPVHIDELLSSEGVKQHRVVRILRHMKEWNGSTCSEGKGKSGKIPTGVSNGGKALANYGLRLIFQRMQLRQLDFKNNKFVPVYATRLYWFGELVNGEVQHHRRETRLGFIELQED